MTLTTARATATAPGTETATVTVTDPVTGAATVPGPAAVTEAPTATGSVTVTQSAPVPSPVPLTATPDAAAPAGDARAAAVSVPAVPAPTGTASRPRAAAYLRCHPYDPWRMGPHHYALIQLAADLSLPLPDLFFDNGCLASDPLPELDRLLAAVDAGWYQVLLIPGPFVLSLDDGKAAAAIARIRRSGCQVAELPDRHCADGASPVPALAGAR